MQTGVCPEFHGKDDQHVHAQLHYRIAFHFKDNHKSSGIQMTRVQKNRHDYMLLEYLY